MGTETIQQLDTDSMIKRIQALEATSAKFAEIIPKDEMARLQLEISKEAKSAPFMESMSWIMPSKADTPILLAGVGAGVGGIITGYIQGAIPQLAGVNPTYIEIGIGYLAYKYFASKGNKNVSGFFGGMLIGGIGSLVSGLASGQMAGSSSGWL